MNARTAGMTCLLAAGALVSIASNASAQVVAYHHRSTVLGDHLSGYAEVLHADGLNARNRAVAYQRFIRAEREREQLRQERLAAYHYEQEFAAAQIRAKAADNRARQQQQTDQLRESSERLLRDVKLRRNVWPAALRSDEFAGRMLQIESILRAFDAPYPSDIRALRIASEELRTELSEASHLDHQDRTEAIATVKRIEYLAYEGVDLPSSRRPNTQLAQR